MSLGFDWKLVVGDSNFDFWIILGKVMFCVSKCQKKEKNENFVCLN